MLHLAIFGATWVAIKLQDKLHETLPSVIAPWQVQSYSIYARARNEWVIFVKTNVGNWYPRPTYIYPMIAIFENTKHLALFRLVALSKRKIIEPSLTDFTGFPFALVFTCTFSECVYLSRKKANHSRQKHFAHGKSKFSHGKSKFAHDKSKFAHGKSKIAHGKSKSLTAKTNSLTVKANQLRMRYFHIGSLPGLEVLLLFTVGHWLHSPCFPLTLASRVTANIIYF